MWKSLQFISLGLLAGAGPAAWADGAAPAAASAGVPQILQLGAIDVHGKQEVARVLLTIKQALKAPDSTDAAHRDDLVCRFVHDLADPNTYLDCATNATNQQRRTVTQVSRMGPSCTSQKCDSPSDMKNMLESLVVADQPGRRLHMRVNPYDFKKLMEQAAAEATVVAAVPATTGAAPQKH